MQKLEPTYLRYIYDGLEKGSIHPDNAAELPQGLIGLYEEAFDENTSVLDRQKLLKCFAIWALLKKDVSTSFVAEILEDSQEDIQDFISKYSAWFNSPESGKYKLYHERLKVYLLQKLSEEEINILHEKLITRLEKAIKEQKADEFEWYGLEFLGPHYYTFSDTTIYDLSRNTHFQNRQIEFFKNFHLPLSNLDFAIITAKKNEMTQLIIELSIEKLYLRKRIYEGIDLIYSSIRNNDVELMGYQLSLFKDRKKVYLSLLLLFEFIEGEFCKSSSKLIFIHLIFNHLAKFETNISKRGWIVSAPDLALDKYYNELQNMGVNIFHLKKITELVNEEDEFLESNFNDNEYNFDFDDDFDDDLNNNKLFDERKSFLIKELMLSDNKLSDLWYFTVQLSKLDFFNKSETIVALILLLPIKKIIDVSEFEKLYSSILLKLEYNNERKNPLLFSHEIEAFIDRLIEDSEYKKAVDLIPMMPNEEMQLSMFEKALCSSYSDDKAIYKFILKQSCKKLKTNTSTYVNKGAIVRELIVNVKVPELKSFLISTDLMSKNIILQTLIDDNELSAILNSNFDLLQLFSQEFIKYNDPRLMKYGKIMMINWRTHKDGYFATIDNIKIIRSLTIHDDEVENIKLLFYSIQLFNKEKEFISLLLDELILILSNISMKLEETSFSNDEYATFFKSLLKLLSHEDPTFKSRIKKINILFEKSIKLPFLPEIESSKLAFDMSNYEIKLKGDFSNDFFMQIPKIMMECGHIKAAKLIMNNNSYKTPSIVYLEYLVKLIESSEITDDLIRETIEFISNKFDEFSNDIGSRSFKYIPLFMRILKILYSKHDFVNFDLLCKKTIQHVQNFPTTNSERIKQYSEFLVNFSFPAFERLLKITKLEERKLIVTGLFYSLNYKKGIEDKINLGIYILKDELELLESALIHKAKFELFLQNDTNLIIKLDDLFDFTYWYKLKSSFN